MAVEAEELRPDLLVHSHGDRGRHEHAKDVDELSIDTIRTLAIDAVEAARSSHLGTPIALAPLGYQLLARLMKHDPGDPAWPHRARVVLSAGHASMLHYASPQPSAMGRWRFSWCTTSWCAPEPKPTHRSACSSAPITAVTAWIRARCVNACGKFPRCRPLEASISSP